MAFSTPRTLAFYVSSLSTPHFATSYSLSTLGVIDGSVSYLYTSIPLTSVPSATAAIPLKKLVRGYHDVCLPNIPPKHSALPSEHRKPTLLYGTLALPSPTTLSALYSRQINPRTLFTLSLHSKSATTPTTGFSTPPASLLAHLEHDTGRYRVEALGSTDSALFGCRGLWNFGFSPDSDTVDVNQGSGTKQSSLHDGEAASRSKPSLLSAGAEIYYSPLSSVIGLSTGLRFTTLNMPRPAVSNSHPSPYVAEPRVDTSAAFSTATAATLSSPAPSAFPYTITLTLAPLTGSLASTYSIKPTPKTSLSSRFGFNVYSWESEYVIGAEIWCGRPVSSSSSSFSNSVDGLDWARQKAALWANPDMQPIDTSTKEASSLTSAIENHSQVDKSDDHITSTSDSDESVIKLRMDDNWRFRALWTRRIKELLVTAGLNLAPCSDASQKYSQVQRVDAATSAKDASEVNLGPSSSSSSSSLSSGEGIKWKGGVGVEIAYSS